MTIEQLAKEVLSLPSADRARLADTLVNSLDASDLNEMDVLWADKAKRRRDEVRNGQVEPIAGDEGLRRVRESIGG